MTVQSVMKGVRLLLIWLYGFAGCLLVADTENPIGRLLLESEYPLSSATQERRQKAQQQPETRDIVSGLGERPKRFIELQQADLDAYQAYFESLVSDVRLPGAAVVIIQQGKPVLRFTTGVRNVTTGEPVTETTLFDLGPCTQGLTSLLAVHLEADGTLALDQPLEGFQMTDKQAAERVTLRHLIGMTAGIPSYTDDILDPTWAKPEDVFAIIAQAPVAAMPGRYYERSYVSHAAGGFLLGHAQIGSGNWLDDYRSVMQDAIFNPLGMATATFSVEMAANTGNYAAPHQAMEGGYAVIPKWEIDNNPLDPALGLKASLADVTRWLILENQYGRLPSGNFLANPQQMRRRWYDSGASQRNSSSMGWTRNLHQGVDILTLSGSFDRHTVSVSLLPTFDAACAVMINADGDVAERLSQNVSLSLAEMLAQPASVTTKPASPALAPVADTAAPVPTNPTDAPTSP